VITVVSGMPRSGTSLMMQMLAAGGMPILADEVRPPDADNPRGYYEWEPAKLLPQQPDLIAQAEDRAVKVISQLLFALPGSHHYRIIFLTRPLTEVVASQAEMIRRRGTSGAPLGQAALVAALEAHLKQVKTWIADKVNIAACFVEYHQTLHEPRSTAEAIQRFLGIPLDTEAMARQVDLALYRQRTNPSKDEKSAAR